MSSGSMQNPSTLSSMGSYSQMGPNPIRAPRVVAAWCRESPPPQHQQRLQQMRQQMLLQQQQKQQMHSSNPQQAAALVAQLQRQMNVPGRPPGQQNPPQYNAYQQPPQYWFWGKRPPLLRSRKFMHSSNPPEQIRAGLILLMRKQRCRSALWLPQSWSAPLFGLYITSTS